MTSKIRILDETTINQIAAGEVIEDSSSVIKELIENSLDAAATEITIETVQGGQKFLSIKDNGLGMSRDDAVLSIERHATSKIQTTSDLMKLTTMGFRGEALASIASISKLTIITAEKNAKEATLVQIEGGRLLKVQSCNRTQGTTIEVADLFYNVPVRKKFQKSSKSELMEIQKVLSLICFANPFLAITWINDDKKQWQFYSQGDDFFYQLKKRIETFNGKEWGDNIEALSFSKNGCDLRGYISKPHFHRPNRKNHFLLINQRPVNSSVVSEAIQAGYGTRLPERRFPVFILHLNLPLEWVDPNVHPQKKEVRLHQEDYIKQFLVMAIERFFQEKSFNPHAFDRVYSNNVSSICLNQEPSVKQESLFFAETNHFQENQMHLSLKLEPKVLTIWGEWIFVEGNSINPSCHDLYVFEQRGLDAKLLYERILQEKETLTSQVLLIPQTMELPLLSFQKAQEHKELFEKIGMSISFLSGNSLMVESIPAYFEIQDIKDFLINSLEEFDIIESLKDVKKKRQLAHYMWKSTKKRDLSIQQAQLLLRDLLNKYDLENPFPTPFFTIITKEEMLKKYGR